MESFRIDDQALNVESAIQYLYRNGKFTDAIIFCNAGSEEFSVHKLILAIHSPVLSDKFFGKSSCTKLDVGAVHVSSVRNMIRYFYNEPVALENVSEIKDMKKLAERYQIKELANVCQRKLYEIVVEVSNVVMVLEMAMEFGDRIKEKECLTLISQNKETVFTSQSFMEMKFENVLKIFEELQLMDCLTEVQFLFSALRWCENKGDMKKSELMKKVKISKLSMDEFCDIIISFPEFFNNIEIASTLKEIKSIQNDEIESHASVEVSENTHTESKENTKPKCLDVILNEQEFEGTGSSEQEFEGASISCLVNIVKNRAKGPQGRRLPQKKSLMPIKSEIAKDSRQLNISKENRQLNVCILDSENGKNTKQARITIKDEIGSRSLRFEITEILNQGNFISWLQKNGDYTFDDVKISYEGLYFMMLYLHDNNQELHTSTYIEVLKAAIHFEMGSLADELVLKIANIIDYDPVFLDGLRHFDYFEDRCVYLVKSETSRVILHPNFINCSLEFITLLLEQTEMYISDESQLLLVTIMWLEAQDRLRWDFRDLLLSKIAFENISCVSFEYCVNYYPKFFIDSEIQSIVSYRRCSKNVEEKASYLPSWYNFKSRFLLPSKTEVL